MRKLQVLQNSTLRLTLRRKYDTPTLTLLSDANVLSVNQLVAYNIIVQVFKTQQSRQPFYHYKRLFGRHAETLQDGTGTRSMTRHDPRVEFNLSQNRGSFFYTAANLWNMITPEMPMLPTKEASHQ
jgi:hypothetical protein